MVVSREIRRPGQVQSTGTGSLVRLGTRSSRFLLPPSVTSSISYRPDFRRVCPPSRVTLVPTFLNPVSNLQLRPRPPFL